MWFYGKIIKQIRATKFEIEVHAHVGENSKVKSWPYFSDGKRPFLPLYTPQLHWQKLLGHLNNNYLAIELWSKAIVVTVDNYDS